VSRRPQAIRGAGSWKFDVERAVRGLLFSCSPDLLLSTDKARAARRAALALSVGVTGFEPAASASRTQRSTKLSYTPWGLRSGIPPASAGGPGIGSREADREWAERDSNPRRLSQRIYSPPRLTTPASARRGEPRRIPPAFDPGKTIDGAPAPPGAAVPNGGILGPSTETAALPYPRGRGRSRTPRISPPTSVSFTEEPPTGLEPVTSRLQITCSAN
jgi:hypothetical protein